MFLPREASFSQPCILGLLLCLLLRFEPFLVVGGSIRSLPRREIKQRWTHQIRLGRLLLPPWAFQVLLSLTLGNLRLPLLHIKKDGTHPLRPCILGDMARVPPILGGELARMGIETRRIGPWARRKGPISERGIEVGEFGVDALFEGRLSHGYHVRRCSRGG